MANTISKPNDIFVSTLMNGLLSAMDLIANNITAQNTLFMSPEFYKESPLVKKQFTDDKGNFKETDFLAAYQVAADLYADLALTDSYKKLEQYIEYNQNDIFAPVNAKKTNPEYEVFKLFNPSQTSFGISSLFTEGKATKSMRELAQLSKIWDSDKQEWMDKTADLRGILDSLFGKSLVYATYDEDVDETDPLTGRVIHHKKGDWKLNPNGQYYTETIGNRNSAGKEFVAASDTLTSEDSWLNKIDFFDSDDIEKSVVGTVFKAASRIVPFIIPQTRIVWGGVTAAINLGKVIPAFAKMAEGIVSGGDAKDETGFTKAMNDWENYLNKYSHSLSDEDKQSNWSFGALADQLTDIVSLLYQMRAAASISRLVYKDPTKQAIARFLKDFLPRYIQAGLKGEVDLNNPKILNEIVLNAASKLPEIKNVIENQTRLSGTLSRAYMALISAADVYQDALTGGYDRRTAGLAGIAATLGQFGMLNIESKVNLGAWMLDPSVGYSREANRKLMRDTIRPFYDEIAQAIDKLSEAGVQEEKNKLAASIFSKIGKQVSKLSANNGSVINEYLRNAMTEATEEVAEEAVMDATKGMFDFMTWAGFGKNKNASFGVVDSFRSGTWFERYLQNAVGGFAGGFLFSGLQNKVEPWADRVLAGKSVADVKPDPSLIRELANGNKADIMAAIDEIAKIDSDVAALPADVNGKSVDVSADEGTMTRGQLIARVLKSYVNALEGAMVGENTNLTDNEAVEKAIRDTYAISLIKSAGVDKLLIADFSKLSAKLVDIKLALKKFEEEPKKKETEEEKKETSKPSESELAEWDDGKYDNKSKEFLEALLDKTRKEINEFLAGKKGEQYLYKTLVAANPLSTVAIGLIPLYQFAEIKLGKEWKDIKGTAFEQVMRDQYKQFTEEKNLAKKYAYLQDSAYRDTDEKFSKYLIDYIKNNYKETHLKLLSQVLSLGNFSVQRLLDENDSYEEIVKLSDMMAKKSDANAEPEGTAITLGTIFKQDVLKLKPLIEAVVNRMHNIDRFLRQAKMSKQDFIDKISLAVLGILETRRIETLKGMPLLAVVSQGIAYASANTFKDLLQDHEGETVGEFQLRLIDLGILLDAQIVTPVELAQTDNVIKQRLFDAIFEVDPTGIELGISSSILLNYIENNETIDGWILRDILTLAKNSVESETLKNYNKRIKSELVVFNDLAANMLFTPLSSDVNSAVANVVTQYYGTPDFDNKLVEVLKPFAQRVISEINSHKDGTFTEITSDGLIKSDSDLNEENVVKQLVKIFKNLENSQSAHLLYEKVKNKTIKENTILKGLSEISFALSDGEHSKVLDILQDLHNLLRKAELFSDYMPKGEAKAQLVSARLAIAMLKALASGMRPGELSLESPFAINFLMQRFLKETEQESSKKYETLDQDALDLINQDLDLLDEQLGGYLILADRAYSTNRAQDRMIREKMSLKLVEFIKANSQVFTIHDVSFLPTEQEISACKTDYELAALYAHSLFTKFHEQYKTQESRRNTIKLILNNLNLKWDDFGRTLVPSSLNKDLAEINEYDKLLFIVSSLSADYYEFLNKWREYRLKPDSQFVPLYNLEQAAWQAFSFLSDDYTVATSEQVAQSSIHNFVLDFLATKNPKAYTLAGYNSIFIDGITGAGKTSVEGGFIALCFPDKLIQVTAPNERQQLTFIQSVLEASAFPKLILRGNIDSTLEKILTKEGLARFNQLILDLNPISVLQDAEIKLQNIASENQLLKIIPLGNGDWVLGVNLDNIKKVIRLNVDLKTIPEIILYDEATILPPVKMELLGYLSKEYDIKTVYSGDSSQKGVGSGMDTLAMRDLNMWRTAKLNLSVRAANNLKSQNNLSLLYIVDQYDQLKAKSPRDADKEFRENVLANPDKHQSIYYFENDETFNGDKFVNNLSNSKEDIKKIFRLNEEYRKTHPDLFTPVGIITELDENGNPVDLGLISLLQECLPAGVSPNEAFLLFSFENIHLKAVQGAEARYFIIDKSFLGKLNAEGEKLRSIYTFTSRAKSGSLLEIDRNTVHKLGLNNILAARTQIDELAQLSDKETIIKNQKEIVDRMLANYLPKDTESKVPKTETVDGKEIGIRSNVLPLDTTKQSKKKTSSNEDVSSAEDELTLPEESLQTINEVLSKDSQLIEPEVITEASTSTKTTYTPYSNSDKKTTVNAWPLLIPIGLKKDSTNYWRLDEQIKQLFGLEGMLDPNRGASELVITGYFQFQHLLIEHLTNPGHASLNGILAAACYENNVELLAFLLEVAPSIANNYGINLDKPSWERVAEAYRNWFNAGGLQISNNYYIFAKRYNYDFDQPHIKYSSESETVGNGKTALYCGIKIVGKDSSGETIIDQWTALSALPKRVEGGEPNKCGAYLDLYNQADKDLENESSDLVVYRVDKNTSEPIKLSSTLWLRKTNDPKAFTSLAETESRGFKIDREKVYLVDNSKVEVNGQLRYKALVLLAQMATTSADVNEYFGQEQLSFNLKLDRLELLFVIGKGTGQEEFTLAGSYMCIATFSPLVGDNSSCRAAFQRVLFAHPKANSGIDVIRQLKEYSVETPSKEKSQWRYKLSNCKPSSLSRLIGDILAASGAFADNLRLLKALLYIKSYLDTVGNKAMSLDKTVLNSLIKWVESELSNRPIPKDEFVNRLMRGAVDDTGTTVYHRTLLMPFVIKMVRQQNSDFGVLTLEEVTLKEVTAGIYTVENTDASKLKKLNRLSENNLSDCYACPIIKVETTDNIDNSGKTDVETTLIEDGYMSPFDDSVAIGRGDTNTFGMFRVLCENREMRNLGLYGYELLSPILVISDVSLKGLYKLPHEEAILIYHKTVTYDDADGLKTRDYRFPPRRLFNTLPVMPDDFLKYNYAPEQLDPKDGYYESSKYDPVKKVVAKDKNGKDKTRPVYKRERRKVKSKSGRTYYKWVTVKTNGYRKVYENVGEKQFGYNSRGFRVRPGDVVLLWGEANSSFLVDRVDFSNPADILLVIKGSGDAFGNGVKTWKDESRISVEAVTKMLKRAVKNKATDIQGDYYQRTHFVTASEYEEGDYANVFKSPETLDKMLDALEENPEEPIQSLDFAKHFFIAIPILESTTDPLDMRDPYRIYVDKDPSKPYIDGIGDNDPIQVIDSVIGLLDYNDTFSEKYPEAIGYTLYRVLRTEETTIQTLTKGRGDIFTKMRKAIAEKAGLGLESGWIGHQIILDEELLAAHLANMGKANEITLDYDLRKILDQFPPLDTKLVIKDGKIDANESAIKQKLSLAFITFNASEWDAPRQKESYPRDLFIVQKFVDQKQGYKVHIYPNLKFFTVGAQNYDGPGKLGEMVRRGLLLVSGNEIADYWRNLGLVGIELIDYQFDVYDETLAPNQTLDQKASEANRRNKGKLTLDKSVSSLNKHILVGVIQNIYVDKNGKVKVDIEYSRTAFNDLSVQAPILTVSLEDLLISLGVRFEFTGNKRSAAINPLILEEVVTESEPEITQVEDVEYTEVVEGSENGLAESTDVIDFNNSNWLTDFIKDVLKPVISSIDKPGSLSAQIYRNLMDQILTTTVKIKETNLEILFPKKYSKQFLIEMFTANDAQYGKGKSFMDFINTQKKRASAIELLIREINNSDQKIDLVKLKEKILNDCK